MIANYLKFDISNECFRPLLESLPGFFMAFQDRYSKSHVCKFYNQLLRKESGQKLATKTSEISSMAALNYLTVHFNCNNATNSYTTCIQCCRLTVEKHHLENEVMKKHMNL